MEQTRRMDDGDRMLIACIGGPTAWRAATFPLPFEIEVDGVSLDGVYVLVEDGPVEEWSYQFVAQEAVR
jgi:hypothetical protein